MSRRIFFLELTDLSEQEKIEVYSQLDIKAVKTDTVIGWGEGSEAVRVFWDADDDFYSVITLPPKCICSDITDSDFFDM